MKRHGENRGRPGRHGGAERVRDRDERGRAQGDRREGVQGDRRDARGGRSREDERGGRSREDERGSRSREDERGGRAREADERGRERFTRPRESPGERVARAFSGEGARERRPREFDAASHDSGDASHDSGAASRDSSAARREPARVRANTGDGAHVFGVQPVLEALRAGARPVERITLAEGAHESRLREILEIARYADIPVRRVPRAELQRVAAGANHQGVVATIAAAHYTHADELLDALAARVGTLDPPLAVVLDGVEDPRNLGAIIRTTECAGAHGVFVPERRAAGLTETVAKAAAGALEYVPVARVTNVVRLLEELKGRGVWTVGTAADAATSYADWDWTQPCALLLGGEGEGLRRLVRERCDTLVRIPLRGRIQSLNVSVAAGIVLYEALRQRTARRGGAYNETNDEG
jgi:23S rRNA (guanosine2251-2'-O)-methyltransferase